jgi:hypothetical protein
MYQKNACLHPDIISSFLTTFLTMLEVYNAHNVLDSDSFATFKIESVDCWEDNVFIGTSDGYLFQYCVERGDCGTYKSQLITMRKIADAKAVFMLKVLLPVERIVAGIDGNDITVLSLTTLQEVEVMANTKGCKAFCINTECAHSSVCVVVKAKLMLFDHVGCFVLAKEIVLPDIPDVVHWRGNRIAIAYKNSYSVMSSLDGIVEDLAVEFHPLVTRPFISFLQSDELILINEGLGIMLNCSGVPTRSSLNLSDSAGDVRPISVLAASLLPSSESVVIVLQGHGFGVFGLDNDKTLQWIEVKSALGMCENGDRIYVFGKEGVVMLLPVPPALLGKQLLSSQHADCVLGFMFLFENGRLEQTLLGMQLFEALKVLVETPDRLAALSKRDEKIQYFRSRLRSMQLTELHLSAVKGSLDSVKALLDENANLHAVDMCATVSPVL